MDAHSDWAGLGAKLIRRRIDLDERYYNRTVFARERGLEYTMVLDIEKAKRRNYEPQTIAKFEIGYELPTGAIERALAGGELLSSRAEEDGAAPGALAGAEPGLDDPVAYLKWAIVHMAPAELAGAASVAYLTRHPPAPPVSAAPRQRRSGAA